MKKCFEAKQIRRFHSSKRKLNKFTVISLTRTNSVTKLLVLWTVMTKKTFYWNLFAK